MGLLWEGPAAQLQSWAESNLDKDRLDWFHDWWGYKNDREFARTISTYDNMKGEGPFPFKPTLMATLRDDYEWPENPTRRIEKCTGLSRSGLHGVITTWACRHDYEAWQALDRLRTLPGLLLSLRKRQDIERTNNLAKSNKPNDLDTLIVEEEDILKNSNYAEVQDLLYPYYLWAGRPVPFEYHRKGTMMIFHLDRLPPNQTLAAHRILKKCPVFMVGQKAIGIWFDDHRLAIAFRLKYTEGIPLQGEHRMVINNV